MRNAIAILEIIIGWTINLLILEYMIAEGLVDEIKCLLEDIWRRLIWFWR